MPKKQSIVQLFALVIAGRDKRDQEKKPEN